jgi:transposase
MATALLPNALWELIEPLLSRPPSRPNGGRPRVSDRACLTGILFVLRCGIPWQMLPQELGLWFWHDMLANSGLGRWRWVVERTFAWLNQFRRLRVRYDKRADIHEAFLSLACALICWHALRTSWMPS